MPGSLDKRSGKLRRLAQAQATFRHLAALVAQGAPPEELFAAFADELGPLLPGEAVAMGRYLPGGELAPVAVWKSEAWPADPAQVLSAAGFSVGTGAPVGDGWAVSAPLRVEGRLWGEMAAYSPAKALPTDAKARLLEFAELMATVIANAESRAALAASRARIVAASDEARRRIERDLHDGAQQRLVSLALELRAAQAAVPAELGQVRFRTGRGGQGHGCPPRRAAHDL
jgi:signal transduction histidine kinase